MELDSRLVKHDLLTLIDAVRDWQRVGDREIHMLQMVSDMPMPPEDHEVYEYVVHMKKQYSDREREIKESSDLRAEKATLLSAKLYLAKTQLSINGMLDLAEMITTNESGEVETEVTDSGLKNDPNEEREIAYDFIRDCGIWKHFSEFRSEKLGEFEESS